jgi:hypothetical protein
MKEAEWLACEDSGRMIAFLWFKAPERKLRLFACACCRRIYRLLPASHAQFPALAERYADGKATAEELDGATCVPVDWSRGTATSLANIAAYYLTYRNLSSEGQSRGECIAGDVALLAAGAVALDTRGAKDGGEVREFAAQSRLVRCVFGNPFRPVAFDDTWRTPDVTALATAAYEERLMPSGELALDRLAVLADALEEVGAVEDIVAHLRSSGPHVRGCWAVDLCLGKA